MTERIIYNALAGIAAPIMPGWQIPEYAAPWPPRGKRLEMEITSNDLIDQSFTGRKVVLTANFCGAEAEESCAAMRLFCGAVRTYKGSFTVMRLEEGSSESFIEESSGEVSDTANLTLYIKPNQ